MIVILGLGSNIGDRLAHLRKALRALHASKQLRVQQVSPVYQSDALLPDNAPSDWNHPYLNVAIRCETNIAPLELLKELKTIEWSIGRKPEVRHWGPRILDIDILICDDLVLNTSELTLPHAGLYDRPFALWPLADVAPLWRFPAGSLHQFQTAAQVAERWGSRFSGEAPFKTQQILQRIDTPELMGIINITPDSFSDGGLYLAVENAAKQIENLVAAGADIIDLGAESTSPRAEPIDAETEWQRLQPILQMLKSQRHKLSLPPKISVDTRHAEVAKKALEYDIHWINDVSGLDDPNMRELMRTSTVDCVVMHHVMIPERRDHVLPRDQDPFPLVYAWGEKRIAELEEQGINRDRIIFDPGIGFGKMAEHSLRLLQDAREFANLGTRILLGHSRKTFFSLLTPRPFAERDIETLSASLFLATQSIDYLRVHDVGVTSRAFKIAAALRTSATV